jgi:hypothetical protein
MSTNCSNHYENLIFHVGLVQKQTSLSSNQKLISSHSDITGKNADFVLSNNQSLHPVLYQYG